MSWDVEEQPVQEADCKPCLSFLNPVYWDQPTLTVTGADNLKFYVLTYAGPNPVVVTVGPSVDDSGVVLGCLILFQARVSVPVTFVGADGVTLVSAGLLKPHSPNSIVGVLSTSENDWAFGGDFSFV